MSRRPPPEAARTHALTPDGAPFRRAGRRTLAAFLLAAGAAAPPATAPLAAQQVPRGVSPRLARAQSHPDTTVTVWVLARAGADLEALARALAARGARVRHVSAFARGVSAVVRGGDIAALMRLSGVARIQPVGAFFRRPGASAGPAPAPGARRPSEYGRAGPAGAPGPPAAARAADTLYGANGWVADQLNLRALHGRGLRGAGVTIAMLDAGFNTLHPFMAGATIVAERDFVYGDSVVRDQPGEAQGEMDHGTGTWSLIAANAPGQLFGVAPAARFILAKTEFTLTETRVEEDNWVAALEWAIGLGAQIVSSSLGYLSFDGGFTYSRTQLTGDVAVTTVAADSAAARGVLVVTSAGNSGPPPQSIDTPGDADSIVSVGATDSTGRVAAFSSRGPTADGRLKPEVAAPGQFVTIARIDSGTTLGSGTSYAAPLVAGLAALVQGERPGRPAIELRQGLIQAAARIGAPDNNLGHGIPNALSLLAFPQGLVATAPLNGPLATVTPTFAWQAGAPPAGSGPNVYFLRVGTDTTLRTAVLDTFTTATSFAAPRAFAPGTRLWWRVVASSTLGVVESTAVHGPLIVPPWAALLSLASPAGASIRDSLPVLAWHAPAVAAPPGPFSFDVDVYPASRTPAEAVASGRALSDTTFRPIQPLERNLPYRWRVIARLGPDSQVTTSPGTFLVIDETAPSATLLFQNFPNPFPSTATGLATTCIWFDVALPGEVQLDVYDLRGRLVKRLVPSATVPSPVPAGRYGRPSGNAAGTCDPRFAWDGTDASGAWVRPGVYVYRLRTTGFSDSRRMVWLGPRP